MKALVMGGTGFIGRRLVTNLLRQHCEVTVASSGRTGGPFGVEVRTVRFDRLDSGSMKECLGGIQRYDVVFDQLCYDTMDAEKAVDVFGGRIGRYVFVSSAAVYRRTGPVARQAAGHPEEEFDPLHYTPREGNMHDLGYDEGKRTAEAYLFRNAPFPVAAARFTSVAGHDDSTLRFQRCVSAVLSGERIVIPPGGGRRNLVWVEDAGRFLAWLGLNGKEGAYNGASPQSLHAVEIARRIGDALGKRLEIERLPVEGENPFYFTPADSALSTSKAEGEGFTFTPVDHWLATEAMETVPVSSGARNYMADIIEQKEREGTRKALPRDDR